MGDRLEEETSQSTSASADVIIAGQGAVEEINAEPKMKKQKLDTLQKFHKRSLPPTKDKKTHFIGIHLGAGTHSLKLKDVYERLCRSACEAGLRILKKGGTANDAVAAATVVLENSGIVNAGRGSNLTMNKTVECDAGFMSGDGYFGGVGAVEGVPNPILIAQKLSEQQDPDFKLSCGRVPPMFLVGDGAKNWGISQNIPTCDPSNLISQKALKRYAKYMKRIESEASKAETSKLLNGNVNDTVGVVALDHANNVAASVSSGGNWLKFPGRIGHSPLFGAGCFAVNRGPLADASIAISTTGVGEMLSKVQWAAHCGTVLQDEKFNNPVEAISTAIKNDFLNSPLLSQNDAKLVGMIGLIWDGHRGEFVWGHSAQSLVVAYGGTGFLRVKVIFSNASSKTGTEAIKVEAVTF